jgi:drug/metabolite transporter (DMT)-like permease
VIWGSLHPISKQLLEAGLTPTQIALARLTLAALTMLVVAAATGRLVRLARLPRRELLAVALVGLCGYFVSISLSLRALTYLPAAMNSLLANTSPLFVALFAPALLHERPTKRALLGLLAGFAGVTVLALSRGTEGGTALVGVLLSLIASATWSLYTTLGRWATARLDAVLITLLSSAVSLPPLAAVALAEGRLEVLLTAPPAALLRLAWLGVVGTGCTFLIWTAALRRLHAASVSAYSYLIPVFGVVFAYLLLGEQPTPLFLLGAALTLLGVAAAQTDRRETGIRSRHVAKKGDARMALMRKMGRR